MILRRLAGVCAPPKTAPLVADTGAPTSFRSVFWRTHKNSTVLGLVLASLPTVPGRSNATFP